MTATSRWFTGLLRVAALLALVCLLAVGWSVTLERPWLYYQNLPFPTEMEKVKAGDPVILTVERCSTAKTAQAYRTTHALKNVDTAVPILLADVVVSIDPGCHRGMSKINVIPKGTPPGVYVVYGVALVPGLLQTFAVPWYSETFEVIP